jgi:hypothetical protein
MVVVISFYMKLALYYNGGDDYALMNVNGFEIVDLLDEFTTYFDIFFEFQTCTTEPVRHVPK